ncbi:MAG: DUF3105 domain-containing protein [Nocardioides sp.]|jgi:hypothetical protein
MTTRGNGSATTQWIVLGLAAVLALLGVTGAVVMMLRQAPEGTLHSVREFEFTDTTHQSGPIDYPNLPPAGGPHAQRWWDCGVFDDPIPSENAVHSLEHGTVWLTYRPGFLDAREIDELSSQLPSKQIISPLPEQDDDLVVTVWGRQLVLNGPDDPALATFLAEYADGHTSPEPFASCEGGLTEPGPDGDAA